MSSRNRSDSWNRSDDLTFVPGSDKAGDVVTIGAHFDSWHTGPDSGNFHHESTATQLDGHIPARGRLKLLHSGQGGVIRFFVRF